MEAKPFNSAMSRCYEDGAINYPYWRDIRTLPKLCCEMLVAPMVGGTFAAPKRAQNPGRAVATATKYGRLNVVQSPTP